MTAQTPNERGGGDVSETLSELERKLGELERRLASTGPRPGPAPPPPSPPPPSPPRPATAMGDPDRLVAEARARLGGVGAQVDELLRFREQLQRTARELEEEYSRVLARIAAPAATSPHDDAVFEGPVVVDAGPFADIAALSAFEQGLARLPGAEAVDVSRFEGNRALVRLRLAAPVPLVREMRAVLGGSLTVTEATAGRLCVDVHAGAGA